MSLEDKFYPEDGTLLTKLDNILIKSAGKVGEAYQYISGNTYRAMVKQTYSLASIGFAIGSLPIPNVMFLNSILIQKNMKNLNYETPLEEEIRLETQGQDKYLGKKSRVASILCTTAFTLGGAILLNTTSTSESRNLLFNVAGIQSLVIGISFASLGFAEYSSKAQMPDPPEKKAYNRLKDKIKEYLTPTPQPVPLPITVPDRHY